MFIVVYSWEVQFTTVSTLGTFVQQILLLNLGVIKFKDSLVAWTDKLLLYAQFKLVIEYCYAGCIVSLC